MIRVLRYTATLFGSIIIILIAAPLLLWMGRSTNEDAGEIIIGGDWDDFDDLGDDIDE